ncbi:hypothetical protein RHS01_10037 [Rhizoctonia solani]|uniref:Uncharacterized protein n=1 Tax=Rhizoctonia solani TaxID=456999 RepID=A0A8H7I4U0_9AGAM|nr:hypothetical protein RHS01_10037 [Rhizoctonia solani]
MPPGQSIPQPMSTSQSVMDDGDDDAMVKAFKLNSVERAWVIDKFYPEFLTNKAHRGARNKPNGKTFAHSTVTDAYIAHHWGSWSEQRKEKYKPKLRDVIYNLFNNRLSHDETAQKANEASKAPKKPKKISPENEWSRNNPHEVQREMNKYLENTPGSSWSIGSVRHVTCRTFEGLPSDQKQYWQDQAEAERQRQNAVLPYQGENLVHYISDWMKLLNRLALDGEHCGNLSLAAFVGWQSIDSNGVPVQNVDIYTSDNIAAFKDSPEQIEAHAKFTHWLEGHTGIAIGGGDPAPAVIPNPKFHNRPEMPLLAGKPKVALLRQQNRDFINADWCNLLWWVGPVPWSILVDADRQGQLRTWIYGWPEDLKFEEPSNQNLAESLRVYELLRARQDGLAVDQQFRFKRVFGSSAQRQYRASADYDGPVDKPQGEPEELGPWLGLASVSNMSTVVLIPDAVLTFICGFLSPVDPLLSAKVIKTLEMVNTIEEHGPHTTPQGIWGLANVNNPLPVLMPARKLSTPSVLALRIINDFWVPDSYGMSTYAAQTTLECGSIGSEHQESPVPRASSLDLDSLGHGEFYKICKYFDAWSDLCKQSVSILSKSSHERIHSGDNIAGLAGTLDKDLTVSDSGDSNEPPCMDTMQSTKATGKDTAQASQHAPEEDTAPVAPNQLDTGSNLEERILGNETVPIILDNALFQPTPQRQSTTDFDQRKHIFGLFAAQPDIPTIAADPEDIAKEAKLCLTEAQAAVSRWHALDTLYNIPYPLAAMRHAQALSQRADESIRPLVVIILLHWFNFNRCRDLWPQVKLAHQGVLLSLRKLSQICKALEDLVRSEAQSQVALKKFGKILAEVRAQSLVCRAIVEPLKQLENISTYHANNLKDLWDTDIFELDPTRVAQLVHGLDVWRDQAKGTLSKLSVGWEMATIRVTQLCGNTKGKILQQYQLTFALNPNPSHHADVALPRLVTPKPEDTTVPDVAQAVPPPPLEQGIQSPTPDCLQTWELALPEQQDLAATGTGNEELPTPQVIEDEVHSILNNIAAVDGGPLVTVSADNVEAQSETAPVSGRQSEPRCSTCAQVTLAGGEILQPKATRLDVPANVLRRSKRGESWVMQRQRGKWG